jgi:signal peptidase I
MNPNEPTSETPTETKTPLLNEGTGATNSPPAASTDQPSWGRVIWENVLSIGIALLLVFGIRSTIVEAFKIPSGSMIPTLLIGDHIFVNKLAYGIKVPFSDWIGDKPIYLMKREAPKQGDIVVFVYPNDPSLYYIKRVIGTPGDVVTVNEKEFFVNGQPLPRDVMSDSERAEVLKSLDQDVYRDPALYWEKLAQGKHLMMLDQMVGSPFGEGENSWKVPEGQYFVMGDNRDHSNDSRAWGFVPFDNIRGRAFVVWLSFQLNWEDRSVQFRPERIWNALN